METRQPHQPPIETTPDSSPEAQTDIAQEPQAEPPTETRSPRGFEGRHHTLEAKAKISEANKGEKNPNYGRKHTSEAKARMSEASKAENLSLETRARMSAASKGRKHTPEAKVKMSESKEGEKNYGYDKSIDKIRLAIIDCVLGETQSQASLNQGFGVSWLPQWKNKHPQRFQAFYLEAANELDRLIASREIGSHTLELLDDDLAAEATRQELARQLARHLLDSTGPDLAPASEDQAERQRRP